MLTPPSKVALAAVFIGSTGMYSLAVAPWASAFSFNGDRVGINADDKDREFKIYFDGNVATQKVSGLSAEAIFKFLGFKTVGSGNQTKTEAAFEVTLDNTSSNSISSRTSALGFNVTDFWGQQELSLIFPQVQHGQGKQPRSNSSDSTPLTGVTRSSGIFDNATAGAFPNQFGTLDVCFTEGNTCQGGGSGGISTPEAPGKFTATLALSGEVSQFALSNFGVRYQSIEGTTLGTSGTGEGTWKNPDGEKPKQSIPEPSTATALLLAGLGLLRRNRRKHSAHRSR